MTKRDKERPSWRFWLQWTLGTGLGGTLGFFIWFKALELLDRNEIYRSVGILVEAMAFVPPILWGILIGLVQCLSLKKRLSRASGWIYVTAIGWALVLGTAIALGPFMGNAFDQYGQVDRTIITVFLTAVAFAVLLRGLIQWFFFLRLRVPGAGWWIPASSVSIFAAGYLAFVLSANDLQSVLVFSFVHGALTGLVMTWMLRRTESKPGRD